jgi:hypothetical protein
MSTPPPRPQTRIHIGSTAPIERASDGTLAFLGRIAGIFLLAFALSILIRFSSTQAAVVRLTGALLQGFAALLAMTGVFIVHRLQLLRDRIDSRRLAQTTISEEMAILLQHSETISEILDRLYNEIEEQAKQAAAEEKERKEIEKGQEQRERDRVSRRERLQKLSEKQEKTIFEKMEEMVLATGLGAAGFLDMPYVIFPKPAAYVIEQTREDRERLAKVEMLKGDLGEATTRMRLLQERDSALRREVGHLEHRHTEMIHAMKYPLTLIGIVIATSIVRLPLDLPTEQAFYSSLDGTLIFSLIFLSAWALASSVNLILRALKLD